MFSMYLRNIHHIALNSSDTICNVYVIVYRYVVLFYGNLFTQIDQWVYALRVGIIHSTLTCAHMFWSSNVYYPMYLLTTAPSEYSYLYSVNADLMCIVQKPLI